MSPIARVISASSSRSSTRGPGLAEPSELGFGGRSAGLDLPYPRGDHGGVGASLQRCPVPCQLAVALGDLAASLAQHRILTGGGTLSGGERIEGLGQVPGLEELAQPLVEPGDDPVLAQALRSPACSTR